MSIAATKSPPARSFPGRPRPATASAIVFAKRGILNKRRQLGPARGKMNIASLSGSQKLAGSSLAFLLMCAAALHAEGPEKLVPAGDALDEKNKNSEALSFYLEAAAQS